MIKLSYLGSGAPFWIIPQNIASVEELNGGGSLVTLVNKKEFSAREQAADISEMVRKWWLGNFSED